jgi:hypothetical protein
MGLEYQTKRFRIAPQQTQSLNFTFDNSIKGGYMVGLSGFHLEFPDTDHPIKRAAVEREVNKPNNRTLGVEVTPQLAQPSYSEYGGGTVALTALAVTGREEKDVVIGSHNGIPDEKTEGKFKVGSDNDFTAATLDGFILEYDEDHYVETAKAGASTQQSGSEYELKATAKLSDSSGNEGSKRTVDATFLGFPENLDVLHTTKTVHVADTSTATVTFTQQVDDYCVFLQDFSVSYPNSDQWVRTLAAGSELSYLAPNRKTLNIHVPKPMMRDESGNRGNGTIKFVVLGWPE